MEIINEDNEEEEKFRKNSFNKRRMTVDHHGVSIIIDQAYLDQLSGTPLSDNSSESDTSSEYNIHDEES